MPEPNDENDRFEYDPQAAARGWEDTAELRQAVGDADLPSVDLTDVAILGLRISRELMKPEVRGPFEELPSSRFDHALLDRIEPASWALWYGNTERLALEATEKGGRIEERTLAEALAIKARMMRVCEYMLSDHPVAGREVASIRSGVGHKDLASDLARLAKLYGKHSALLAEAGKHYAASDEGAANAIAARMLFELGETRTKALHDIKKETAQAFAVLQDAYDRIRRWAAAIWNDDERLPSLYSVRPYHARDVTTEAS